MFFLLGVFISPVFAYDFSPWSSRSTLTLSSSTPSPSYKVRLVFNAASFSYSALSFPETGKDLRFSDAASNGTNLKYYIESWNNAGQSIVWVDVPTQGTSSLYMFYGNAAATDVSSTAFADTFPSRLVVTANTSMSLASGVRSYDWIDIQSGAILTQVPSANYDVLSLVSKSQIKVAGTITGVGNKAGGSSSGFGGEGPGGGPYNSEGTVYHDGIGGGYGGRGGAGYDSTQFGPSYDVATEPGIQSGSGGSYNSYSHIIGGTGGGAVVLQSPYVNFSGGIVYVSGQSMSAAGNDFPGSPGSGGGIMIRAGELSGASGSLLAEGGVASNYASRAGGGRIKLYIKNDISSLTKSVAMGLNLKLGMLNRGGQDGVILSSVTYALTAVQPTFIAGLPTVYNYGSWSTKNSVAVTWASAPTPSDVVHYQISLGTSAGDASIVNWVQNTGTSVNLNTTGLLTYGNYYFVNVRAVTISGATANVSYQFQLVDPTLPTTPSINSSIRYTSSNATVVASWGESTDPETGILKYQVSLGNTRGEADLSAWQDALSLARSFAITNLTLTQGQTYYVNVRAFNGMSMASLVASYDVKIVDVTAPSVATVSNTYSFSTILTEVPIEWLAAADSESNVTGYEVSVGTTAGGEERRPWEVASGTSATILNAGLTNGVAYYANVRSVNGAGLKSAASSFRFVADITAPSVPTVNNTYSYLSSTTTVPVSWAVATDNQSVVTGYEVSIGTSAGVANTRGWQSVSGTSNTVTTALNNGGTYYANVRAVNGAGLKSGISSFSFLVDNMAPSVPTISNTYSYLTSTSNVPIRWSAATDAQSGVTGYEVSIGASEGATDNVNWTSVAGLATTVNATLTQGNIYYANVRSVNGGGAKSSVSSFSFKVDVTVPSVPTVSNTYSYLTSSSAVPIRWEVATDSQSLVTGYEVSVGTSSGATNNVNWTSVSGTSATVNTSLTNGNVYYANVRAINGAGLKSSASSFSFIVDTTAPSVPTVSNTYGYRTVTDTVPMAWGASTDSQSGLVRYEVALGINGNRTSVSGWTTFAIANVATTLNSLSLVSGTRYYASVRAVNDAGLTSSISSFNFVVDTTAPSVPVVSSPYQYLASTSNVPIQWGIGSTDSESGIGLYQVSLGTSLGASNTVGWTTVSALATTLNGLSLTNGTRYYANVRAINNAGLISSVSSFNFKVDVTASSVPTVSNTYGYLASSTAVPIKWASSTDSQSDIVRYEVALGTTINRTIEVGWTTVSTSNLATTLNGLSLVNGSRYYASVRAINGSGLISSVSSFNFKVDTTAASAPTLLNTYTYLTSVTTIPIEWSSSADSESGVTGYEVSIGTSAGGVNTRGWQSVVGLSNTVTTTLTNGGTYYANVRAVNGAGLKSSISSFSFKADVTSPTTPLVQNTYAYLASSTTVPIVWTAGVDSQSGILRYEISVGTDGTDQGNWVSASGLSDTVTTAMTNGSTYYGKVRAVNGAGLISDISSFSFIVDTTAPSVPTVSNTYAYLTSSSRVPIRWGASADSQSGLVRYEVALGVSGNRTSVTGWTTVASTNVATTLNSVILVNGTRYYASVKAINGSGLSSVSSFNFVVDTTSPSNPTVSNTYGYLTSTSTVPIRWSSATDNESGVPLHQVALGTSVGATNNVNWTSVGLATTTTLNGLSLTNGTRYYASVRAINNAGLISSVSSFNFKVDVTVPSVPTVSNTYVYLTSTSNVPISWVAASDSQSDVSGYEVSVGDGAWNSASGTTATVNTVLVNGSMYSGNVRAINGAGLKSFVSSFKFIVDVTVPSVPTVSNTYSYLASSSTVPIKWGVAADSQSGLLRYEVALGTVSDRTSALDWTSVGSATETTRNGLSLTNGTRYYASVRAVNGAGLASLVSSFNFVLDTTLPSVPTVSNTYSYLTSTSNVPIRWLAAVDAESVVTGYEVSIGTGAGATNNVNWTSVSGLATTVNTTLTQGNTYYANVRAVNSGGGKSGVSSFGFKVDVTVPSVPTVSNTYSYLTSSSAVPIRWATATDSQSDVSGYEVSVGGGEWRSVSGTSATVNTTLVNGNTYSASVRSVNGAGLKSSASSFSFKVDTTAPSVPTVSNTYAYRTVTDTVPVSWAIATDNQSVVTGYEVSIGTNGGSANTVAWQSVSGLSTTLNTSLTNGSRYYVNVRSINTAGLKSGVSSFNFMVDTTAPSEPVISTSYAYRTSNTVPFSWEEATDSQSGVSGYEVSIGTSAGATNNVNWTSISGISATVNTTLTNGGVYYANVRAINAVGLKSGIASFSFIVDSTAPSVPTVSTTYSYLTSATTVPMAWTTATDSQSSISGYEVSVGTDETDQGNWVAASGVSTTMTTSLTNGNTYYAKVRSINGAGLKSGISSFSFKVDTTAPSVPTVSNTYAYLTSVTTVPIVWASAADDQSLVSGYEVSVGTAATDQGNWVSVSGVTANVTTSLTNGSVYYAKVRAINSAGLKSPISSFSFKVDTTVPSVPTVSTTYAYLTSATTVPIAWTAAADAQSSVSGYEVSVGTDGTDQGSWVSVSGVSTNVTTALTNGSVYYAKVRAINGAGLKSPISSFSFKVDTTAPNVPTVASTYSYLTSATTVPIVWTAATDSQSLVTGYEVSVGTAATDKGNWISASGVSTNVTTSLTNGSVYYAKVRAINGAGLKSSISSLKFLVDTTAPSAPTITSVYDYLASTTTVPIQWRASIENQSGILRYEVALGTNGNRTGILDWTSMGTSLATTRNGLNLVSGSQYFVSVRAVNNAGLISNISSFNFVADTSVPSKPTMTGSRPYVMSLRTVPIAWIAATDSQSGISGYEVSVGNSGSDQGGWTFVTGLSTALTVPTLNNGSVYYAKVRAVNGAGLKSGLASYSFRVDVTAPAVPTVSNTFSYLNSRTKVPLSWAESSDSQSDVSRYDISIGTATGNEGTWTSAGLVLSTIATVPTLNNGGTYYGKVRAINGSGVTSNISWFGFVVDNTAPSVPTVSYTYAYLNSLTTVPISWAVATDAQTAVTGYEVSIGTSRGATNNVGWTSVSVAATTLNTTLINGGLYFVNVRAINAAGLKSGISSFNFTADTTVPSVPTVASTYSYLTSRTLVPIRWTAATDSQSLVTGYQVSVSTANGNTATWTSVTGTATTLNAALTNGAYYYAKVRAVNGVGLVSELSSFRFMVDTTAATVPKISDASRFAKSATTAALSWTASTDGESGVNGYEVSFGSQYGGSNLKSWTAVGVTTSATLTGLNLLPGQLYFANVRAINAAGLISTPDSRGVVLPDATPTADASPISYSFDYADNGVAMSLRTSLGADKVILYQVLSPDAPLDHLSLTTPGVYVYTGPIVITRDAVVISVAVFSADLNTRLYESAYDVTLFDEDQMRELLQNGPSITIAQPAPTYTLYAEMDVPVGTTLWYTLDGRQPTVGVGTLYKGRPISVLPGAVIKSVIFWDGQVSIVSAFSVPSLPEKAVFVQAPRYISTVSNLAFSWALSDRSLDMFYMIGTTPLGSDVVARTGVSSLSVALSALHLQDTTTYYVSVGSGKTGDVFSLASFNVTVDTTPASTPVVVAQVKRLDSELISVPMSWTAALDAISGVTGYEVSIGSTSGADDVLHWQSVGLARTVTLMDLPLIYERIYYANVRSINGAGLVSNGSSRILTPDNAESTGQFNMDHTISDENVSDYVSKDFYVGYDKAAILTTLTDLRLNNIIVGKQETGVGSVLLGSPTASILVSGNFFVGDLGRGTVVQSAGVVTILGTLKLGSPRSASSSYTLSAGSLVTDTLHINAANGSLVFTGGELSLRRLVGSLTNGGGVFIVDLRPGAVRVSGSYTQGVTSELRIIVKPISTVAPPISVATIQSISQERIPVFALSQFLRVAGILDVQMPGLEPQFGMKLQILDVANIAGTFSTIRLPELPVSLKWDVSALYTTGTIKIVGSGAAPKLVGRALNYPNPFRADSGTSIGYELDQPLDISVYLYTIRGNLVKKWTFNAGEPGGAFGYNTVAVNRDSLDGQDLSVGVYMYVVTHGSQALGRGKMVVMP